MRNTIWNTARKLTLGMAVVAGFLTVGAVSAKAAPIQFQVSFGDRYNCPGEGYVWVEGYYNGGYWVPGEWVFRGYQQGYGQGYAYQGGYGYRGDFRYDHERRFEGYRDRGWDRDRGRDRDRDRGWGGDRNWNRGGDRHSENDRHFDGGRGNDHGFGGDHHNRR